MLDSLRNKSEATRHKIALGGSILISLLIFSGWFYSKGYLGYSTTTVTQTDVQTETTKTPILARSPIENTRSTFSSAFDQIGKEYQSLKDSMASVIVPFITGIDVYNKGDSK